MCDCEMKWYKKWWEGDWQKIDTDHIKVEDKFKIKIKLNLIDYLKIDTDHIKLKVDFSLLN